ncbi:NAD(P)-dependent dehydrogenase (short-subunit alcohol dehydrogenase family) [Thermocatellispora tengchongensis]|uniref:NAD(P)-dependent dehydrogenase (Short-subunit alcohol dehydrogenase family) n=1 Tax=Thermocatellispora tengchongensis TaxID=1073253 RepID=A0A840PMD8_9ACTN|nr:SDR family NAD(P)-dependent oxidoreductase [Thermocatellispora tengchongensis]MBB5140109.1 NAD(P)-dependent dehydrogenase (short-subunit alcohol dehydrogenase family) [Thermocatellispora tengchongensis]
MRFDGKTAVVTGGASGIGLAAARRFAAEGARVAILDLDGTGGDAEAARLAGEGHEARFYACDVTDGASVTETFARVAADLGGLDVLHANAGIQRLSPFPETTREEWDATLAANLTSVFLCGQAAARIMIRQGRGGAIVTTSSIGALLSAGENAAYSASKAGVNALTRSMALSLAPHGIRVNAVGPGTTVTGMTGGLLEHQQVRDYVLSRTPLRRLADPDDIAGVVLFLAGEDARYITAQTVYADGGRLALNFTV